MSVSSHYLENVKLEFQKLKKLGEDAFVQIKDEHFFFSPDEETNSIATIIRHLSGNMKSRWTDIFTTDGEKEWRNRDQEFDKLFYTDEEEVLRSWEEGWSVLFKALDSLKEDDLLKKIKIRGEEHTIIEAVNRQLTHYAYHVGQIVYMAKYLAGKSWNSLSVPRGESAKFNDDMRKKNKF